jgi:hypothetical protein
VTNLVQSDQVLVYAFNGVSGDNFQAYYQQQDPGYVLPQSTYNADGTTRLTASPQAGLSNAQAWAQYHVAFAGALAPTTATRPGVGGFVRAF